MFRSLASSLVLAAAALLFTVATAQAQQTYLYGNYGTIATSLFSATVGYVNGVQNNTLAAQGFTLGSTPWEITQIDAGLATSGTGASAPKVFLFDDNAGLPGNQVAEYSLSGSISNSKVTHFFTGSYQAAANTSYWAVLGDANAPSQSSFEWYLEDTSATPTGRNASGITYLGTKVQSFSAGPWSDTISGLSMKVNGVAAVPEPSTYAFLSMTGLLAAGTAARRKFFATR